MKTKRYYVSLAVVATLGLSAALVGRHVRAQDVPPEVATGQFGTMGAIRGETVRLAVSNINLVPPDVCHATLEFVGLDGQVLLRPDGTPIRKAVSLEAGQSAFVQFNAGALLGRDETRLVFRPVLMVVPPDPNVPPDPYHPADPCVPSLEVIDAATSQTRLAIPGSTRTYSSNHNETLVEDR
jgi:hypothetical protein